MVDGQQVGVMVDKLFNTLGTWVGELVAAIFILKLPPKVAFIPTRKLLHPIRLIKPHSIELARAICQYCCGNAETTPHRARADRFAARYDRHIAWCQCCD